MSGSGIAGFVLGAAAGVMYPEFLLSLVQWLP